MDKAGNDFLESLLFLKYGSNPKTTVNTKKNSLKINVSPVAEVTKNFLGMINVLKGNTENSVPICGRKTPMNCMFTIDRTQADVQAIDSKP